MVSIVNDVVSGGPAYYIPAHLSFGEYLLNKFRTICEHEGDRIAMINGETGQKTTYHILLQELVNIGTGLKKLGVKNGDVVALCSENKFEYLASAFAAVCCGATITPINLQYTKDEMTHVLKISKPNVMMCSEAALQSHSSTFKSLPFLKTIIQIDGTPTVKGVLAYQDVAVLTEPSAFEAADDVRGWEDVAYILYSSGTTGLPKGVMLTHMNVLYSAANFENSPNNVEDVVLLTVVPWYHAYGLMSTVNYLIVKKQFVYFSEFNPRKYLNAIQEYKVNVLVAVPPIVVFLAKSPLAAQYDLSSVFAVLCGAAPLSSETINDAMKRLPGCIGIFQGYGMTETSLVATLDLDFANSKPGSGGYPIPGLKAKVVDLESGRRLGANQSGEICLKGPQVMKGYAGNEAATRDMMDAEGYLKTGDIGYYDSDGCFFVVDRLKELIKYKGHQVPPAEVESVLLEHPGVAESAVVGAPSEAAGELPTAFVVPKPQATVTEKEIIDFAASRLSHAKRLHGGVIFVDAIPKNPSGKILRRVLKQMLKDKKKSKL